MANIDDVLGRIGILVVDDMEAMRSMVGSCLREMGVQNIYYAGNGKLAWEELNNKKVDLIICDWDMPEVTGIEFLEKIKRNEQTQQIPFLMLTASVEKSKVFKAIEFGVNDYLAKPFKPKDLEYRVVKLLRKIKT